jgi:predicted acyl esterase
MRCAARAKTMIEERDLSVAVRDGRRLAVDVYPPMRLADTQ